MDSTLSMAYMNLVDGFLVPGLSYIDTGGCHEITGMMQVNSARRESCK